MNVLLIIMTTVFSLLGISRSCQAANNLAHDKPYSVFPIPNYKLSAPPSDVTMLTDGKYTTGNFWTQRTTVGWENVKTIEIEIDLETVAPIRSILFSTARGKHAGVHYPAHIAAFVGPDKEHLLYVGDMTTAQDNRDGEYQVKRFVLDNIDTSARYVVLEIEPKGRFLFCDEVEVLAGVNDKGRTGSIARADVTRIFEAMKGFGVYEEFTSSMEHKIRSGAPVASHIGNRLSKIRQIMATLPSVSAVASLEAEAIRLRYEFLRAQYPGRPLLVESISPWSAAYPISLLSGTSTHSVSFDLLQGGHDTAAIAITSLSPGSEQLFLDVEGVKEGVPEVLLSEAFFVKSAEKKVIPDALIPITRPISIKSGELKVVVLTAYGARPGRWSSTLMISFGKYRTSFPVQINIGAVALPGKKTLHSVNWSYLDFSLIRERSDTAVKDLTAHHTNVLVVPPRYIPRPSVDGIPDFAGFRGYVRRGFAARKVLLFMNYRSEDIRSFGRSCQFLDERWKAGFKEWYRLMLQAAAEVGLRPEQVYLYPYDEMHGDEIGSFINFSQWSKKAIPGIRFYSTLSVKDSLRAIPHLDIAQVFDRDDLLNDVRTDSAEIWIYDCSGPAKSLSPYSYYRLMAWKAYLRGYKGIGFWAYADAGDTGTAWNDFDGTRPDYAVIYEGEGKSIISSRRWEAWRMGIEDYELLTMYAKVNGDTAAKALAKDVLENSNDATKADIVRRSILMMLSQ